MYVDVVRLTQLPQMFEIAASISVEFGIVFSQCIFLGHDVAEMPESQLRSVVIHELAHIRRGDFLANLLGSVAMLLYWPNRLFCLRLQFDDAPLPDVGRARAQAQFHMYEYLAAEDGSAQ